MRPSCLLLALAAVCVTGRSPLLCQRKRGLRVFKKDEPLNCLSNAHVQTVEVQLKVPSFKEAHASGHWTGLYKATCETHYFFWGSYTREFWHVSVPLLSTQRNDIKQGGCPSLTHPVPLLHHPEPSCVYTWPKQTNTEIMYCITRPTTIRKLYGQPLTSDEEQLDERTVQNNGAFTVTGAVVHWEQNIIEPTQKEVKYTGVALLQENQLIIESLQEGFMLLPGPTNDGPYEVWKTIEGYELRILQKTRNKRQSYQEAMQGEITSKLQYESYIMDQYLQKFQQTCFKQQLTTRTLDTIYKENADEYARALLNETDITAATAGDYLLVWPCKRPEIWYIREQEDEQVCTQDIPIIYTSDAKNYTGYYKIRTGRIVNDTNRLPCESVQTTPFMKDERLYTWDGRCVTRISTEGVKGFAYPNQGAHMAPVWSNHWLYHESDFHREPPLYLTKRDIELQQLVQHTDTYTNTVGVPFMNMPSLPSLARCLELFSLTGGFLYLMGLILTRLTRQNRPPPTGTSPLELYRLMRQNT
ncbi:envelope glycoprotein [Formica fusca virus 1]|uniref:Envelope glycoprotein n=1 Tax=Formica fusca virus 1 TaxID=2018499 RepID=A0A3G5FMD0_9MONO|nr:envelope glycoprotein [Formica fusca virus 1]AYW51537.1 envelope glycoprotein [Formica fusca virus 1]